MMPKRGPSPVLIDNEVLREWWAAAAWSKLAPVIEQTALGVVQRMGHTGDAAQDMAQEVLIACWRTATVPDAPAAFVARAARNKALDAQKKAAGKYEVRDDDAEELSPEPNALEVLLNTEHRERLRLALRLVPEHLRRPLVLHVFHQRTISELAAQFSSTEGAMKMRLVRARSALREVYDDDAAPPALPDFKFSTHAKRHGTVEVRAYMPLASHDHRVGTWCLPELAWHKVRAALVKGFALQGLALHIDDTHAARHGAAGSNP